MEFPINNVFLIQLKPFWQNFSLIRNLKIAYKKCSWV